DNYGHQVGDEVIKRVAEQIKDNIRKTDLVGRYGGDEFLVAFRDCERPEELEVITKKIKRKIADLNDSFEKIETEITVSAGIHIANNSFEDMLTKVDNCLYSAKDKGTDNLVINAE
ncbi:MAG: GGDEF domain-containing protein, partial [Bacillota bacterium]